MVAFWIGSMVVLSPWLAQDFFPSVDSGQFKLHVRARTGTRIEDTARLCDQVEDDIRAVIPKAELGTIIDNIGLPYPGLNLSYSHSAPTGPRKSTRARCATGSTGISPAPSSITCPPTW